MTNPLSSEPIKPVIEVRNVHKSFGILQALRGVNFMLEEGQFLTIFGPNGAGKTTLLKILSGLTMPSEGSARIAGFDVSENNPEMKKEIGVITHASCLYADLTAAENLVFYAKMYGIDQPEERAAKALEDMGLKSRMGDRVRMFSRGMQQRVSIARAVLHNPSVLFLDEPFTGLDPQGSNKLKETLRALHTEKRTVIMTTHDILCGLEMSDRVAIQAKGRLEWMGDTRELDAHRFEEIYFDVLSGKNKGV